MQRFRSKFVEQARTSQIGSSMTLSKTAFALSIGCGILLGALSSADAATHHRIAHSHKGFSATKRPGRTTPAAIGPGGSGETGPSSGSVGK
jgi:hypothetical protein